MDIVSFFIDWRSNLSKLSVGHTFIRGRSHLYFHQLGSKKAAFETYCIYTIGHYALLVSTFQDNVFIWDCQVIESRY